MYQALRQRFEYSSPTRAHTELAPDISEMIIHTRLSAIENSADFPGGFSGGTPLQHFFFPIRQRNCDRECGFLMVQVAMG